MGRMACSPHYLFLRSLVLISITACPLACGLDGSGQNVIIRESCRTPGQTPRAETVW
uniref:Uncharacterized protein n=1 Tax=Anguilla anguilla TaxID=7936 RepID=A0A0E9PVS2_ANGAN